MNRCISENRLQGVHLAYQEQYFLKGIGKFEANVVQKWIEQSICQYRRQSAVQAYRFSRRNVCCNRLEDYW